MSSLTERFPAVHPQSVSPEGGGLPEIAALAPFLYQDMRWCVNCGGEKIFVEQFECELGRMGVCLGCGEEKFVAWTRTNSEVA